MQMSRETQLPCQAMFFLQIFQGLPDLLFCQDVLFFKLKYYHLDLI